MPRVSIITALYNHERFIARAMTSVLAQTFTDWELIVWDDGSSDGSLAVARQFAEKHPDKIKVFTHAKNANRGQEKTRNAALKKATGELIGLLDSDDYYHPEKLAVLVPCFENHRVGLAYGSAEFYSETTAKIYPSGITHEPQGKVFDDLIEDNFLCAGATLFRRQCVARGLKFDPEFRTIGEYPLWLKIARDWEFAHVVRVVAVWRKHAGNLGSKLELEAKAELVRLGERLLDDSEYGESRDSIARALSKRRYDYASELYTRLDLQGVRAQCLKILSEPLTASTIRVKAGALVALSLLGRPSNKLLSRGKRLIWELRHRDLVKK